MSPTRREFLLASTAGVTALTGCSALSGPEQSLLVSVNNYTESRHHGHLLVEAEGREVVRQYLEVAAAEPDGWTTVETKIALGEVAGETRLEITASFGDGLQASSPVTLDCSTEYTGDVIYVQIEQPQNIRVNEACYDEFPSAEASQGGVDQS